MNWTAFRRGFVRGIFRGYLLGSFVALMGGMALLLSACGGGGDNIVEPGQQVPKTDCTASPEACK